MKVVFVGTLETGNTTIARLKALDGIKDCEVYPFDSDRYFPRHLKLNWLNRIDNRLFLGPRFWKSNHDLRCFCEKIKPEVIWVDKGFWIWSSTVKYLKSLGSLLVHYNTDYLKHRGWSTRMLSLMMRKTLPFFDIYFTTNMVDYKEILLRKITRVELTYLGFDHHRFNNNPLSEPMKAKWESDILFVGHHEPNTEAGILALIENGLSVTVFGHGWNKAKEIERLKEHVKFRSLNNDEYIHALKSAKIGLCFFSLNNKNQTAGRSFEIPACGTFLLAMRSEQHLKCYSEGKEAEFFDDYEELVKKARYYLKHEAVRQEIANNGHQRCIKSDYSYNRYMNDNWYKVLNILKIKNNET